MDEAENVMPGEWSHLQKTIMLYESIYMKYPEQANPERKRR